MRIKCVGRLKIMHKNELRDFHRVKIYVSDVLQWFGGKTRMDGTGIDSLRDFSRGTSLNMTTLKTKEKGYNLKMVFMDKVVSMTGGQN